jgi:hypothetical protein
LSDASAYLSKNQDSIGKYLADRIIKIKMNILIEKLPNALQAKYKIQ